MQIKEAERANRKNKQQKLRQLILWVSCMFVISWSYKTELYGDILQPSQEGDDGPVRGPGQQRVVTAG